MNSSIKIRKIKSKIFTVLVFLLSGLLMIPLFLILYMIISKGIGVINWQFLVSTPKSIGSSLHSGIANSIVGTVILIGIAVVVSVPLGVFTGIHITEHKESKLSSLIRTFVDIIQSIPSIIFGLIGFMWFVLPMRGFGVSFSALAGGLTLSLMMLPIIIKSSEETLKLIPNSLREASVALGASYHKTIFVIVLPAAMNGIFTGIILGISRIAGETAPLLFTAFGNDKLHANIFKPIGSLPLTIYNYALSPYDQWIRDAWGASFILVVLVLSLNIIYKVIGRRR